jgi:hypothetical protein
VAIIDLQFVKHRQNVSSVYGGHAIKQNLWFAEAKGCLLDSKHLIFKGFFLSFSHDT